jgi:hypothetical protein
MNLGSKIVAAALLTALPCLAAAAPIGVGRIQSAPAAQNVDWRGGHWHGDWFPDRRAWGGGLGFAYAPYDYDYPGYSTYAYEPGYDYSYSYSAPGYYDYGYAYPAPGRDAAYCEQRFRSYDPASGTYLGFDGIRHPCP